MKPDVEYDKKLMELLIQSLPSVAADVLQS
jgi:hypothetical protein